MLRINSNGRLGAMFVSSEHAGPILRLSRLLAGLALFTAGLVGVQRTFDPVQLSPRQVVMLVVMVLGAWVMAPSLTFPER